MKLHLGCGKRYIPGFTHIDLVEYPHIDYKNSIDDLSIFEDNSIDLIYNCHVLEHFHKKKIPEVLNEWYRVLKPKGILRISVPDFQQLIKVYKKWKDIDIIQGPLLGGQTYLYNFHNTIFDYDSLIKYLYDSGFKSMHRYDWKNTEHANIDDYSQAYIPHMDKKNGIMISLNIEAIK